MAAAPTTVLTENHNLVKSVRIFYKVRHRLLRPLAGPVCQSVVRWSSPKDATCLFMQSLSITPYSLVHLLPLCTPLNDRATISLTCLQYILCTFQLYHQPHCPGTEMWTDWILNPIEYGRGNCAFTRHLNTPFNWQRTLNNNRSCPHGFPVLFLSLAG